MKLTELTIGDWVRFPNNDILDQVICIDGLRNEIDGELCSHNYCDVADLQPIPLTAEILKKNGFETIKGEDNAYHAHPKDGYVSAVFSHRIHIQCLKHFGNELNMVLKYVHELQHALRLCGLNDFASNFKI